MAVASRTTIAFSSSVELVRGQQRGELPPQRRDRRGLRRRELGLVGVDEPGLALVVVREDADVEVAAPVGADDDHVRIFVRHARAVAPVHHARTVPRPGVDHVRRTLHVPAERHRQEPLRPQGVGQRRRHRGGADERVGVGGAPAPARWRRGASAAGSRATSHITLR